LVWKVPSFSLRLPKIGLVSRRSLRIPVGARWLVIAELDAAIHHFS
jgi:hypothetical protein